LEHSRLSNGSIADVVLARPFRIPKRHWGLAVVFAIAVHGGLLTLALNSQPTLEFWASDLAIRVHQELGRTQDVTVAPEPPPREEPPPPVKAPPPPATSKPAVAEGPRAPAQAGQIIAQEPADATADLTAMAFVTGEAKTYAGGKTTATGKSDTFVAADTPTSKKGSSAPAYSQPIAVADDDWICPWPQEADASEVNRQSAVVRVVVGVNGRAKSSSIVKDPGLGFGSAAADCAMRAHYFPAKDAGGNAVESESAIRVRFER
jgi:outer membrane biosynthesis protein TonB